MTPRGGVKISSHQEEAETVADELSGGRMELDTGRSTLKDGAKKKKAPEKGQFSKRLIIMGNRVGVDMSFAKTHNEALHEQERRRRAALGDIDSSDSETEGDEAFFDDVDLDSWEPSNHSSSHNNSTAGRMKEKNSPPSLPSKNGFGIEIENQPPALSTSLNLSNLHSGIAWGDNIKVDSAPATLDSRSEARPKSERDLRTESKRMGNVVRVKSASHEQFFSTYKKFDKMARAHKGKDWFVHDDGTEYVSAYERQLKEDNFHRRRGGMFQGGGEGEKHSGKWKIAKLTASARPRWLCLTHSYIFN